MSADAVTPSLSYFEEIAAEAAKTLPELLKILEESISDGGHKNVRVVCGACSRAQDVRVKVHDLKDVRDHIALLNSSQKIAAEIQSKRTGEDASRRANAGLHAIEEMPSVDIAEEIARIDKELAA